MRYEELTALAKSYSPASQEDLMDLANGYQRRGESEILELAALAADLSTDRIINLGREPELDPQILEALERHYHPNPVPVDGLDELSDESLDGLVGAVKGIYFEVLVRDRLNDRETVGDLSLEPWEQAELADPSQHGWDLKITDGSGEMVEQISFKAHQSMQPIKEALEKYPDFQVAVPDHINNTSDEIIGTDVSLKQLTDHTDEQLSEISEGALTNAVDVAAETALDVFPLGSALIICATEGRHFLMSRTTFEESMKRSGKRLIRPTVYSATGTALSATGLGLAAVPIVMGARVAESRLTGSIGLVDNLVVHTDELNRLQFA